MRKFGACKGWVCQVPSQQSLPFRASGSVFVFGGTELTIQQNLDAPSIGNRSRPNELDFV